MGGVRRVLTLAEFEGGAEAFLDEDNMQLRGEQDSFFLVLKDFPLVLTVFGEFLQTDIPLIILELNNKDAILGIFEFFFHELFQADNEDIGSHFNGIDKGIVGVDDHESFFIFGEDLIDIVEDFGDFHGVVVLEFEDGRGLGSGVVVLVVGVVLLELVESLLLLFAGDEAELALHEVGEVESELLFLLLRVDVEVDELYALENGVVQKVFHDLGQRLALL
jgi:hypothetical protein